MWSLEEELRQLSSSTQTAVLQTSGEGDSSQWSIDLSPDLNTFGNRQSATSSPNDNDLSSPQDTAAEEESDLHPSRSKWSLPISVFFRDARHVFRMDALGREILRIAFPAALALAANRATSFVDTAFIHHLGPVESTAAKYSTFLFNQVVNIFTFPLTIVAASRVAKDKALTATTSSKEREYLSSQSTPLVVAAILGVLLPLALTYGAKTIFAFLGVRYAPIQTSAESYLRLRCIGAPAIFISHAMQGVFLGFKDARTHFYATVAGSLANIALDPILIFFCKLGVRGVTVAHVSSRYLIFLILLWRLTKKVYLLPPSMKDIDFRQFLKIGFLVLVRVIVLTAYLSFATFLVTRLGSTFTAVNEACLLVWTIASFTANGLAVAGQVIITSGFAKKDYDKATAAASRLLQMGVVLGLGLAVIVSVFLRFGTRLLSKDVNVQHHIFVGIPLHKPSVPWLLSLKVSLLDHWILPTLHIPWF